MLFLLSFFKNLELFPIKISIGNLIMSSMINNFLEFSLFQNTYNLRMFKILCWFFFLIFDFFYLFFIISLFTLDIQSAVQFIQEGLD